MKNFTPMNALLVLGLAFIVLTLWRAHLGRTNPLNAFDLVMEDGKLSRVAFAFMLVLGVTTWIMIDLQIKGKMTEGYLTSFGAMWVLPLVAKFVFGKTEMPGITSSTKVFEQTTEVTKP